MVASPGYRVPDHLVCVPLYGRRTALSSSREPEYIIAFKSKWTYPIHDISRVTVPSATNVI